MIGLRAGRTTELLPVEAVKAAALVLRGGSLRAVLECQTLAFGIKGEPEQRAVVAGWSSLLNSLTHPLQVVIRTRRLESSALPPPADHNLALRDSYRRLVETLTDERRVLDRRFYVVVPWDAPKSRRPGHARQFLDQRVAWVTECLRRLDLEPRRLSDHSLAELLRRPMDPAASMQPTAVDDDLFDFSDLVAPTALTEGATSVSVSGRHARVIGVSRYPSRLHPGWLGDLQAFDGDLDLALHIWPSSGPAVMSFLERRIGELSSTLRIIDERGGRPDPWRRAALHDAIELQDRIADGSERLFDVALYMTVWADSAYDLDAATGRIEALLGTRLIHTRRLLLQMRPGLVSSMPLGLDQVRLHRVLSTSALSATFPFTGSDLPARSGLLYGVNTTTRSAVVLDRFILENHNAVVFATSGAGKSFLVKVELIRALLSGTRALVVDPEGEYAAILAALGGEVIQVSPGTRTGIDPFAITDTSPGALDTRVATLTTFISLLAGHVRPRQRGAIEDAIALVYARAGFADGVTPQGLTAPRLIDVQARLRVIAGTEDVALRLERFITGAGRWLLSGHESPSVSDSAAYVLAGLPDEERVAAMFLVLDRIWTGLASSGHQTLVVVDEAWWLMRHPDTASFLFRLAKTARKRRAGLTLITQDVSDILAKREGEAMIANSALQILMKQAPQAMPRLAELFRLTPAEQSWLLNAQRGEALMVAQGRRVPYQVIATDEEARLIAGKGVAA
ncbi:MAG: VirB4 family type IV secretion system protein [Candidatus Dormibacteraceae bacterium]